MTTNVDAFPEESRYLYADEGCDLHPRCLECPLIVCQYELTSDHGGPALNAVVLDHVARLMREGLSSGEIAARVGRAKRNVQHYTAAVRRLTPMLSALEARL